MPSLLEILEDYLKYKEYGYFRIDGNTVGENRDASIEAFDNEKESGKFVFLISTKARIKLFTTDVVILYDSDWYVTLLC